MRVTSNKLVASSRQSAFANIACYALSADTTTVIVCMCVTCYALSADATTVIVCNKVSIVSSRRILICMCFHGNLLDNRTTLSYYM